MVNRNTLGGAFLAASLIFLGGFVFLYRHFAIPGNFTPLFAVGAISSASFGLAAYLLSSVGWRPSGRWTLFFILSGLLLRLGFWDTNPDALSTDAYRYLWDGKLVSHGINPFLHVPDAEALAGLRDSNLYPRVEFKQSRTIYPPMSQVVFALSWSLGHGAVWPLRLILLLADLTIAALLFRKNRRAAVLYYLCPLVVMESQGGLHIDLVGAALLLASWSLLDAGRSRLSSLLLSLAMVVKYVPVVLLPFFFTGSQKDFPRSAPGFLRRFVSRRNLIPLSLVLGLSMLSFLPLLNAGQKLWEQLFIYGAKWRFGASIAPFFQWVTGHDPLVFRLTLLLFTALFLYSARKVPVLDRIKLAILSILLTGSALFPWYLLWLAPFVFLRPTPSEIFLLAMSYLLYHVNLNYFSRGIWEDSLAVRLLIYLPFYFLLLLQLVKGTYVPKDESGRAHPRPG